jgi:hypothetical protein
MNHTVLKLILAAGSVLCGFSAHGQAGPVPPDFSFIRAELLKMGEADQAIRAQPPDPANPNYAAQLWDVDAKNQQKLKQIITQIGWPTRSLVGEEAANSAFLIAQHAVFDLPFMQMAFGHIEAGYKTGEIPASSYAKMADRILMLQDKPQRFGTQINITGGACGVWKLANPEKVDALRAEMGLETLADYIARVCAGHIKR